MSFLSKEELEGIGHWLHGTSAEEIGDAVAAYCNQNNINAEAADGDIYAVAYVRNKVIELSDNAEKDVANGDLVPQGDPYKSVTISESLAQLRKLRGEDSDAVYDDVGEDFIKDMASTDSDLPWVWRDVDN